MNHICPNIVKLQSWPGKLFSNLFKTTTCLSKLLCSLEKIFLTSFLLSKTNNRIWSPMLLTLNPFTTLYNGLKILIIASIFKALFVKNLAAIINSIELCSLFRLIFPPSYHSVKDYSSVSWKNPWLCKKLTTSKQNSKTAQQHANQPFFHTKHKEEY